jgi:hypothetical protein
MQTKISIKNTIFYLLGFVLVGLAISLMKQADIGMGSWDTVNFNIHEFLIINTNLSKETFLVGYVSGVIGIIIMLAVLLYRRRVKYLFLLVPILLMVNVINLWYYLVFEDITITSLYIQIFFFTVGVILLPLGLSLVIKSSYPAFVFDEFTFMLCEIFHINKFATARLIIEFTGVLIGSIFGFIVFHGTSTPLGTVGIGTFVVMVTIGPAINLFLKLLKVERNEEVKNV